MSYRIPLIVALCLVFSGSLMAPASAEKRVALVIGNGSYAHIAHLPNVANDAAAVAGLFKTDKFDAVDVKHNLDAGGLRRALREFAGRAAEADVAVVFYAGHGIEVGQVNYLIPVDARLVTDFDVEDEGVPLDRVLQAMEPAKRLRLVILDACRENPFIRSMKRTMATRSVGRGLGRIEPSTTNTLIAFATKPNAIAEDGKGPNSPFTAALVKHLLVPGLDVRIALGHVRDEVLTSTASKQEPYVTGSLGGGLVSIASAAPMPVVGGPGLMAGPRPLPHALAQAGGLFSELDAKRLQALADKHRWPLPDFQIEMPDGEVPATLRGFVGIWADLAGKARKVRDTLLIVTRVDKEGRADGYWAYGPPGANSFNQDPPSVFKVAGTITDKTLRFSSPRGKSTYIHRLTNDGRMDHVFTNPKGGTSASVLAPVWSLVEAERSATRRPTPARR
jgi:caspase domain-containing protein